jgi:hypothetical protein
LFGNHGAASNVSECKSSLGNPGAPVKIFTCQYCGQLLFFENTKCEQCSRRLGYLPDEGMLSALEPAGDAWRALGEPTRLYRLCANAAVDVCNWLIVADSPETLCLACSHNRLIPDIAVAENLQRWRSLEIAKHRLFYSLLRLHLPLATRNADPEQGLAFDFLAASPEGEPDVLTGHADGVITLALEEADSAEREGRRQQLHESFRTLLGHFRHESGHYFWDRLVRDRKPIEAFRELFGDERADYAEALQTHYEQGPPTDWRERFVSAYASVHPWEDFAETWAHYLHIVDSLETAAAFGLAVHPRATGKTDFHADIRLDPYAAADIVTLVNAWLPLTYAVNSLNRSLGQPDLYPFVLTPASIRKLGFVRQLVHAEVA